MLHLIYDTETNGLPIDYKAHVHDVDNWPRCAQLAWSVLNDDLEVILNRNHIINPFGRWEIPQSVSDINGITTERANDEGIWIKNALIEFAVAQSLCDIQVGHNINFDRKIVGAEFIREDMEEDYIWGRDMKRHCTMMGSAKFCRIPGKRGYKWPSLQELHTHLFAEGFSDAHDAQVDVDATIRCYRKLVQLGEVTIINGEG